MAGAMAPSISRTIAREAVIAAVGATNAPSIAAPSTQAICLSLTKIPTGYCMSHRSSGQSVVTTKPQVAYSSPALGSNRYRRSPLIFSPAQEVALDRTSPSATHMSAFGGRADITVCGSPLSRPLLGVKRTSAHVSAFDPKRTIGGSDNLVFPLIEPKQVCHW